MEIDSDVRSKKIVKNPFVYIDPKEIIDFENLYVNENGEIATLRKWVTKEESKNWMPLPSPPK